MLEEIPPKDPKSKQKAYKITEKFVNEMLEHYKNGKSLPRRFVWEIVLGCHDAVEKEQSMVDVVLEEGVTCDVIGDTHGKHHNPIA